MPLDRVVALTSPAAVSWQRVGIRAVLVGLAAGAAVRWDPVLSAGLRGVDLPGDVKRGIGMCEAFAHSFGVVLIAACIWQAAPALRRRIPRLLTCALLPGLVVNALKLLVVRYRPLAYSALPDFGWETWLPVGARFDATLQLPGYLTQSFPSGHAATAFGLAFGLSWLFPSARVIFLVVAGLASFQRIMSAAHWPSDTLAGAAVALLVAGLLLAPGPVSRFFTRWEQRAPRTNLPSPVGTERRAA